MVVVANPSDETWCRAADQVEATAKLLRPWLSNDDQQPSGNRPDLPGLGSPLLIPFTPTVRSDLSVEGVVRFHSFHIGGKGAAHGGTLPLLFDEVLGRLACGGVKGVSRTAFLKVNYRAPTPVGIDLRVEATIDTIDGRKRWVTGRLFHGDTLLADADSLFIELLPGQP
jgi:acyl-coenzyme A thioesterase PaaI-like protein